MSLTQKSFEVTPRPTDAVIGLAELAAILGRTVTGVRAKPHRLPFKRWAVGRAVVFDKCEVLAFVEAKKQKNLQAMCSGLDISAMPKSQDRQQPLTLN